MYKGTITGYYDPKQFWIVTCSDGDVEDWGVGDMKRRVPSFVCGPVIDGVTEHTATAVREKTRSRRRNGRRNTAADVMEDIAPLQIAAESGDKFELPAHCDKSMGTVWKLLKTYVDDKCVQWGTYIAADEAASVDFNDICNLTMDELQDSCDVKIAPLADIETWIQTSATLKATVNANPNARQSTRAKRVTSRLVPDTN